MGLFNFFKKKESKDEKKVESEAKPKKTLSGKYKIYEENNGFKYTLLASNGQTLIESANSYTTKESCINGIKTIQKHIGDTPNIVDDKRGNYFFAIKSNGKILAHSANYSSEQSAISAFNSFKNFANSTKIKIEDESDLAQSKVVSLDGMAAYGKYQIYQTKENKFYFKLIASNGQEIFESKEYSSKASLLEFLERFKETVYDGSFLTDKDKRNNYSFKLQNKANKLVAIGIAYDSEAACRSNIESVRKFARKAKVLDEVIKE